jgi:hypothetical protein
MRGDEAADQRLGSAPVQDRQRDDHGVFVLEGLASSGRSPLCGSPKKTCSKSSLASQLPERDERLLRLGI